MRRFAYLLAALMICSCEEPKPNPSDKVVYRVIDKCKEVNSHYNPFTSKQVVETERIMLLQNVKTGNVFTIAADADTYYRFDKGSRFSVEYPYMEDRPK